jgi:hypothetical protein
MECIHILIALPLEPADTIALILFIFVNCAFTLLPASSAALFSTPFTYHQYDTLTMIVTDK